MGGVFQIPSRRWYVWRLPVVKVTAWIFLTDKNLIEDLTIKYLELAEYVMHVHIFVALMDPLVDNTLT